jgi:phosphoglycerate dehydrogenase-like enzyme
VKLDRPPVLVVEDDRVLRQLQVLLDPRASEERSAAYASYAAHDLPDWYGWREALRAQLAGLFPADVRLVANQDELLQHLPEADVAVVEGLEIGERELALAPRLQLVQNFGVVTENIDAAACARRGIPVRTLRRRTNIALAEHTLMFMLCLARRFTLVNRLVTPQRLAQSGIPQSPYDTRHTASANFGRIPGLQTLHGRTVGLLGFGEIGREVALLARAFGMQVLYHKRSRLAPAQEDALGVAWRSFDALCEDSDHLSVHVPLGPHTRALVGAAALQRMRRGSFLVNTARAEIVERDALLAALASGQLAGAALDVLYQEPDREDDPLLQLPNVILTPHLAGASRLNGLEDAQEMLLGICQYLRDR